MDADLQSLSTVVRRVTTLEEQALFIEHRKAALGIPADCMDYSPVNDGTTRTPEKRRLLRRLAELARGQGTPLAFKANY